MGEKSEFAAKSSIAALQERALDIIASRPEGIYQSDLRRLLEIDSSKCSKVVSRLQGTGLIRRENVPASSTYLIKLSPDFISSPSNATALSPAIAPSPATAPSPSTSPSPAAAPSTATISPACTDPYTATAISAAKSTVSAPAGQEEKETGNEVVNKKQATNKPKSAHADAQMNGHNADATAAIIKSDLESLIQCNADGRIKRMIDQQIDRLIYRRISGQVNRGVQCSIGKIEDAINSRTDSAMDCKRSSPFESEIDDPMESRVPDHPVRSYFDCYIESNVGSKSEEDLDLSGRIVGYFDRQGFPGRQSHIDSYLTEIYLLYLTRASSF